MVLKHVRKAEYDDLADNLVKEWDLSIQQVIDKVFKIFKLLAHHEWIPWGGNLPFTELHEEVAKEQAEEEAQRAWEVEENI